MGILLSPTNGLMTIPNMGRYPMRKWRDLSFDNGSYGYFLEYDLQTHVFSIKKETKMFG